MVRPRSAVKTNASRRRRGAGLPVMTLRALRESLDKTQGDVARAADMTQPQLSRVERRRDHLVSTVDKYVAALGGKVEVVVSVRGRRVILREI